MGQNRNERRIRAIIASQLGVKIEQVVDSARLVEDLGADSLDVVELAMALEEAFEITIPDEQAEYMTRVEDVLHFLADTPVAAS